MKMPKENFLKTKYEFGKLILQKGSSSAKSASPPPHLALRGQLTHWCSLLYVDLRIGNGEKNTVQQETLPIVVSIFQIVVVLQILLIRDIILQEG